MLKQDNRKKRKIKMTSDSEKNENISDDIVSGARSIVEIVKLLVNNPEEVRINISPSQHNITIELHTDPSDVGQVLGKSGHLKDSIRSLLSAFAGKNEIKIQFDFITEWKRRPRKGSKQ